MSHNFLLILMMDTYLLPINICFAVHYRFAWAKGFTEYLTFVKKDCPRFPLSVSCEDGGEVWCVCVC